MRVGVYVDGFNLYYGARQVCGRGTPGWRWLDIRALASNLVAARISWPNASVQRPVTIQDGAGAADPKAMFMVSYAHREEKGSDVNVVAHLLLDIFNSRIDAAVVVSNDSDLAFPLAEARKLVPIGTVNPSSGYLATDLRGSAGDGVGRHWWRQLTSADYLANQLPDPVRSSATTYPRPAGW